MDQESKWYSMLKFWIRIRINQQSTEILVSYIGYINLQTHHQYTVACIITFSVGTVMVVVVVVMVVVVGGFVGVSGVVVKAVVMTALVGW